MLNYDVFFHWALVAKCMSQFFKCLNVKSGGDPPQAASLSLSTPEDSFHNFTG
jgi:hypothetical protein